MARVNEPITVNQVLDARPRIFSLPVAIIVPMMFVVTIGGGIGYILQLSGYMILLAIVVCAAIYFFLFGQQSWKLLAKFKNPSQWIRVDVQAVPFVINRGIYDEKKTQRRKSTSARK